MSHKQAPTLQSSPLTNYNSAIAKAVEWLGDRYLLARPINTATRNVTIGRVAPVVTTKRHG